MNLKMNFFTPIFFFVLMSMASCFIYRPNDEIERIAVAIKDKKDHWRKKIIENADLTNPEKENLLLERQRHWWTDEEWYIKTLTNFRDSELEKLSNIALSAFEKNNLQDVTEGNGFSVDQVKYFKALNEVRQNPWVAGLEFFAKILILKADKLEADLKQKTGETYECGSGIEVKL